MPAASPAPANFVEILERVWWRLDRALDPASLRASAELYVAESVLSGTTALIDHHESPNFIEGSLDVLAEVCESFGMRALLCYGVTERNGGIEEAKRGLEENRRFLERCAERDTHTVAGAVGVHASFTVSDQTLRDAAELARRYDARLHIHVAEDVADVVDAEARGYMGVIARLDELDALLPGSILAHGIHLEPDEVDLASERGCWFVQNPRSNQGNQVGYPKHLGRASRVALGTDGYPANMREEEETLLTNAALADPSGAKSEVDSARRRLDGSQVLGEEIFGPMSTWNPCTPPTSERMIEINERAAAEAERLWERMSRL